MYLSGNAEDEHKPSGVLEALEGPGVLAAVVGRLLLGGGAEEKKREDNESTNQKEETPARMIRQNKNVSNSFGKYMVHNKDGRNKQRAQQPNNPGKGRRLYRRSYRKKLGGRMLR